VLETGGNIALCCLDFLTEFGRQLSAATGDARETASLSARTGSITFRLRYHVKRRYKTTRLNCSVLSNAKHSL